MTREQLLKHWEVIEAYMNGAEVEYFDHINAEWVDCSSDPGFYIEAKYRIKKQPELIPFDFSDAEKLIGRIVVHKDKKELEGIHQITSIKNDYLYFYDGGCNMNYLFKYFTFLDGSPCGKIKE